jgi:hypothetical protein
MQQREPVRESPRRREAGEQDLLVRRHAVGAQPPARIVDHRQELPVQAAHRTVRDQHRVAVERMGVPLPPRLRPRKDRDEQREIELPRDIRADRAPRQLLRRLGVHVQVVGDLSRVVRLHEQIGRTVEPRRGGHLQDV